MQQLLLQALKGDASLKVGGSSFILPPGSFVAWTNVVPIPPTPRPLRQLPEWWTRPGPPTAAEAKPMVDAVHNLVLVLSQLGGRLDSALADLRQDANPAARTLAVVSSGAIDDLRGLTAALEASQPDVRQAAILALRHWIGVDGRRDLQLYRFLQSDRGYTDHQAEDAMMLLHSFSSVAANRPETYDTLIHYLLHEKLSIRELAYWHLSRLVPAGAKDIPYDAAAPLAQRQAAFQKWKQLIPDGQLPPPPK
jgi:hypothetical protein